MKQNSSMVLSLALLVSFSSALEAGKKNKNNSKTKNTVVALVKSEQPTNDAFAQSPAAIMPIPTTYAAIVRLAPQPQSTVSPLSGTMLLTNKITSDNQQLLKTAKTLHQKHQEEQALIARLAALSLEKEQLTEAGKSNIATLEQELESLTTKISQKTEKQTLLTTKKSTLAKQLTAAFIAKDTSLEATTKNDIDAVEKKATSLAKTIKELSDLHTSVQAKITLLKKPEVTDEVTNTEEIIVDASTTNDLVAAPSTLTAVLAEQPAEMPAATAEEPTAEEKPTTEVTNNTTQKTYSRSVLSVLTFGWLGSK